jgi:hypothetical protein
MFALGQERGRIAGKSSDCVFQVPGTGICHDGPLRERGYQTAGGRLPVTNEIAIVRQRAALRWHSGTANCKSHDDIDESQQGRLPAALRYARWLSSTIN